MGEHPRWADDALSARVVSTPDTYSSQAEGLIRQAALRDNSGLLLGWVWTDDRQAAGFLPDEAAGPAGRRAGADVWAIHRDVYQEGRPASDLLDPALYASVGELGEPSSA
ncbi:hypothetical protein [Streptosporangium roseum]|uniref:hypothetical protein n=1 Tax=Streptosporangium roseum TaxID=2001 RepID=UPI00331F57A7